MRNRVTTPLDASFVETWETETDMIGEFALPDAPCLEHPSLRVEHAGYEAEMAHVGPTGDRALRIVLAEVEPDEDVLTGRVVDERGDPVASAWVALGRAGLAHCLRRARMRHRDRANR